MKLTTSFGEINILPKNIAEVIINKDIEISLEFVDEYDALMAKNFSGHYAVLVNRINRYHYAYEALLCVGSAQNLKAAAIINYGSESELQTENLKSVRHMDSLNIKEFSGLELGRDSAINWLIEQLAQANKSEQVLQTIS
tara:strand:- start:3929 stop:4348 length:420 start_codon:yes stop_codon:yes gene_type:complete